MPTLPRVSRPVTRNTIIFYLALSPLSGKGDILMYRTYRILVPNFLGATKLLPI